MSTGQNPLLELSEDKQAELVHLVENGNLDSIADATGIDRRTVLKIGAALGVGSVAGGLSARELVQEARAAADTTDSDGNVGLPGDRVDVFAEGVDANSVSTENLSIKKARDVSNSVASGGIQTFTIDANDLSGLSLGDSIIPMVFPNNDPGNDHGYKISETYYDSSADSFVISVDETRDDGGGEVRLVVWQVDAV